jgi:hypothetical protein
MTQNQTVLINLTPTANYALTIQMTGNGTGSVYAADFNKVGPPTSCAMNLAPNTCTITYPATTTAELEWDSPVNLAQVFAGFSVPPCSSSGRCVVKMDGPKTVTAGFNAPAIRISGSGNGTGTVTSSSGGINCTSTGGTTSGQCLGTYQQQALVTVTLTAAPNAQSNFTGWSGGGCSGIGTCVVTSPAFYPGTGVTAQFVLKTFAVNVTGTGTGSGTVTSNPSGVSCTITTGSTSGTCAGNFNAGASVTFTANPSAGSRFVGWSGACSGTGTCTVAVSAAATVSARFDINNPVVSVSGSGSGTIASNPAGISCTLTDGTATGSCAATYSLGAAVTLTATPASGWRFSGWTGDCTGTDTCSLTMSQDRNVNTAFTRLPVALTVTATGNGTGTVTSSPSGINCNVTGSGTTGTCLADFAAGTNVTLTPTPTQSSTFEGWSNACTGTGACVVAMSQPKTVTAAFKGALVSLTVAVTGTGNGIITSNVGGMNCVVTKGAAASTGCSAGVANGSSVTLTADPQDGSIFGGWTSGGCSGQALTCTVNAGQGGSVGAQFTAPVVTQLVDALLGGSAPSQDQRAQLDRFGNKDGTFNLGDLLALLDRSGEKLSPAIVSAIVEAESARASKTSFRRRKP